MVERGTAVVIEDDADIRGLLEILLKQSGFDVYAVSSGRDGVRAVNDHDPVVVTVDVGLPDIDGFEVVRRVRETSDAYIVMLTGLSEEVDNLMGLEAGADDYITKPFRPRELRARIDALLRRPRARAGRGPETAPPPVRSYEGPVGAPGGPAPAAVRENPPTSAVCENSPASAVRENPRTPAERENSRASAERENPPADVGHGNGARNQPPSPGHEPGSAHHSAERFHYRLDGLCVYPGLYRVTVDDREVQLTRTQFVLPHTLMESRQVVRSKADLFRALRDESPDAGTFVGRADERTIEVHMGNLRRKLGDDVQQPRWIETIRGVGYRLAAAPQVVA